MPGDSGPAYRRFQNLPKGVCPSCKNYQLANQKGSVPPVKSSSYGNLNFAHQKKMLGDSGPYPAAISRIS